MMRFLKSITVEETPPSQPPLGHLETTVMDLLWERGESNVHDVVQRLNRPLAYTTIMTTLDRLFKKGLLRRRKSPRSLPRSALIAGNCAASTVPVFSTKRPTALPRAIP